jgi:hypothetical protein
MRLEYRKKCHKPEKLPWVRVPVKIICVTPKLSMMEKRSQNEIVSERKLQE